MKKLYNKYGESSAMITSAKQIIEELNSDNPNKKRIIQNARFIIKFTNKIFKKH